MEFDLIFETLCETETNNMELLMTVWNQLEVFATETFKKLSDEDYMMIVKELVSDPEFQKWAEQYREGEHLWNLPDKELRSIFFKKVAIRR